MPSLTLANGEGRIQLVLRNSNDRKVAITSGRRLHGSSRQANPCTAGDSPPAPAAPARACRSSFASYCSCARFRGDSRRRRAPSPIG